MFKRNIAILFPKTPNSEGKRYRDWVWPLPSNSDHQDYYIFSRTIICHCYLFLIWLVFDLQFVFCLVCPGLSVSFISFISSHLCFWWFWYAIADHFHCSEALISKRQKKCHCYWEGATPNIETPRDRSSICLTFQLKYVWTLWSFEWSIHARGSFRSPRRKGRQKIIGRNTYSIDEKCWFWFQ